MFLLVCLTVLSCSRQKFEVRELLIERDGERVTVVKAEIAKTQEERDQGLMHRKSLPDGEGMLFVFQRDQIMSFWMKNT
ncbi:MAG: DUF192 domain-containing protein, partial [Treponema sp.]|nr:DUF192 domain-containing protein [Treponema sp.]